MFWGLAPRSIQRPWWLTSKWLSEKWQRVDEDVYEMNHVESDICQPGHSSGKPARVWACRESLDRKVESVLPGRWIEYETFWRPTPVYIAGMCYSWKNRRVRSNELHSIEKRTKHSRNMMFMFPWLMLSDCRFRYLCEIQEKLYSIKSPPINCCFTVEHHQPRRCSS